MKTNRVISEETEKQPKIEETVEAEEVVEEIETEEKVEEEITPVAVTVKVNLPENDIKSSLVQASMPKPRIII